MGGVVPDPAPNCNREGTAAICPAVNPRCFHYQQAPVVVMIENHRTCLVWKNLMTNPEIQPALEAIGFQADPP